MTKPSRGRLWARALVVVILIALGFYMGRFGDWTPPDCQCDGVSGSNDADVVAQQWAQDLVKGDVSAAWGMVYGGLLSDPVSHDLIRSAADLRQYLARFVDRFGPGASPDTLVRGDPVGHVHWVAVSTSTGSVRQTTLVLLVDDTSGTRPQLAGVRVVKVLSTGVEQIDSDLGEPTMHFADPPPGPVVRGDVPAPLTHTAVQRPGYAVISLPVALSQADWLGPGPNQQAVARFSQSTQRGPALLVAVFCTCGGTLYAVTPVIIDS